MAAKKGASLAGRKGPPVRLRNGLRRHHRALDCGFGCPAATFVALRQPRLSSTRLKVFL